MLLAMTTLYSFIEKFKFPSSRTLVHSTRVKRSLGPLAREQQRMGFAPMIHQPTPEHYFPAPMSAAPDTAARIAAFLTKWQVSGAAERANAQLFVTELCALLEVEPPQPSTPNESLNAYCFVSAVLAGPTAPAAVDTIASSFEGKRTKKRLEEVTRLLETLAALGRAKNRDDRWHT